MLRRKKNASAGTFAPNPECRTTDASNLFEVANVVTRPTVCWLSNPDQKLGRLLFASSIVGY